MKCMVCSKGVYDPVGARFCFQCGVGLCSDCYFKVTEPYNNIDLEIRMKFVKELLNEFKEIHKDKCPEQTSVDLV